MDTLAAFRIAQASRGNEPKVLDWEKAAKIIKDRKPKSADAGLLSDYEWTRDIIYEHGKAKKDTNAFVDSTWAIPMLILDDIEEIECWRMQSKITWGLDEKWPKSALRILGELE